MRFSTTTFVTVLAALVAWTFISPFVTRLMNGSK